MRMRTDIRLNRLRWQTDKQGKRENNVISDCFVYNTMFENTSGGIIGKYAAQKNGELVIMNCVVNGTDMEYNNVNMDSVRNVGGICGAYLGEDGGNFLLRKTYPYYPNQFL